MQSLFIFGLLLCSANAQNGRVLQSSPYNNGHGWDIRLAVPGEPGNDYPTLATIPRTSFSCAGKEPGYYADIDTNCQVFRVCTVGATYGFQSFLCPNGTLFNQAVFVCDWWMNVNCKKSDEFLRKSNEQFENLKLGPQLMKDIKQMLTHPVRNPINANTMRSKQLVMQNYKPPSGQLFPNGALLATPERVPSHIYIPTKAIQIALRQDENKSPSLSFSASSLKPQYISPTFSTPTTVKNIEILQQYKLNNQGIQNTNSPNSLTMRSGQLISNGHIGHLPTSTRPSHLRSNYRNDPTTGQHQTHNNVKNVPQAQNLNELKVWDSKNTQENSQFTQYKEYNRETKNNKNKINSDNISQTPVPDKQKYSLGTTKPPYIINTPWGGPQNKQNLVSNDIVPPTVLTKTVAYSRLVQEPEDGQPKSRITFKTWVLKPAKNAKLITNPTPYTYYKPNNIKEQSVFETPYNYNKPTQSVIIETASETDVEDGYNYDKPTTPYLETSPTVQDISRLYLIPTASSPIPNERLLTTTTPRPTKPSRLYIAPNSFNPAVRQYLPPNENSQAVTNQYLAPNSPLRKLSRYENAQLFTFPTSTTMNTTSNIRKNAELSSLRQQFQENNNNLSFSEILSKENLDITINEIVNDTNRIFVSTPNDFNQYISQYDTIDDHSEIYTENEEEVTESPIILSKPAKLVANPSLELQPPFETFDNIKNKNKLSELPFLKNTVLPTIERTISLKITIPESIANYLFKMSKDSELEILKADSNNYMFLKNNQNKNSHMKFSPIGKITWDENSNFSTSQALVFSLLADSIKTAKVYNNIIDKNVISPTLSYPKQLQLDTEELGRISKDVAQLTASQYTAKNLQLNNYKGANLASLSQPSNAYTLRQYKEINRNRSQQNNNVKNLSQVNSPLILQPPNKILDIQNINTMSKGNTNGQIYSGQLYQYPVPEVTQQIINSPNPANANIIIKSDLDEIKSQRVVIPKNSATRPTDSPIENNFNDKHLITQSSPFVHERLQFSSSTETPQLNTQEGDNFFRNLFNTGNSITAQIQDKIVGTIPYPLDRNKFVTYKKDQSYYLYSNLDNGTISNDHPISKQMQSNYPDLITFHFIPTEILKVNDTRKAAIVNKLENYQSSELNLKGRNDLIETSNIIVNDETYTNNDAYNNIASSSARRGTPINTLYDGPSSYSAPQLSIGNLMSTQGLQRNNYNSKIEDLDESNNFNGYAKERPSRQFTFK